MKLSEVKQEFTRRTHMPAKKAFAELVVASGSLSGRRMVSTADWLWVLENMLPHWDKSAHEIPLAIFNEENQKQAEQIQQLVAQNESLTQELAASLESINRMRQECDDTIETAASKYEQLWAENFRLRTQLTQLEQQLAQAQQKPADEAEAVAIAANAVPHVVAGKIFEAVLTLNYKSWFKKLALHLHPDTTRLEKNAAQELFVILSDKYSEIKEKESFHWLDSFDYAPEAYYDPDVSDIPF